MANTKLSKASVQKRVETIARELSYEFAGGITGSSWLKVKKKTTKKPGKYHLEKDLGFDNDGMVELIMDIEQDLGVSINDKVFERKTIEGVANFIYRNHYASPTK
ncbi:hypothetical protein SAMN05216480_12338 [Pustulibacterium marinum]|uniref:Carrier domain-containing protein n=1 Tax=Pustulibacterium marinum TaxID=1224947 RepID=A0A1I7IWH8_9FLAO|nr:acyl carrier protein [Pustulibacterium marinum]SFU77286.1 hypothetical protein SAMN05216480_12338 [Pustulibacterium marinum]